MLPFVIGKNCSTPNIVPIVISVILTTWLLFLFYWHLQHCKPNDSDDPTKLCKEHHALNCLHDDGNLSDLLSQEAVVTPTQDSLLWAEICPEIEHNFRVCEWLL